MHSVRFNGGVFRHHIPGLTPDGLARLLFDGHKAGHRGRRARQAWTQVSGIGVIWVGVGTEEGAPHPRQGLRLGRCVFLLPLPLPAGSGA